MDVTRLMSRRPQRSLYYGWVLIVILGITTTLSYGTTEYLFGVLVIPLTSTFHWTRVSISDAYALGLVLSGVLGIPIGYAVDRWGARVLMPVDQYSQLWRSLRLVMCKPCGNSICSGPVD